jgi:peptidoglycan recognition protein
VTWFSRAEWGSTLPPGGNPMGTVAEAYVHHFNSNITAPQTVAACGARMRGAQSYHASQGWGDIGYSFCVSDAGDIYEGRGWGRTGAHTYGFNSKGYGICWLGDSNVSAPAAAALDAIAEVVRFGVNLGRITPAPTIVAHRDRVPDTACCGDPLYGQLGYIRAAVAGTTPTPPTPPEDDDMLKAARTNQGAVVLIDGGTFRVMAGSWPVVNAQLIELSRAGLLATDAAGAPAIGTIGDNALQALREV